MSLRLIREPMRSHVVATLQRVTRHAGGSAEIAVSKWERRVLPMGCVRRVPDPECVCRGCFERDVAKLLEMLLANVGLPPSEWR
jgi:hypothetical protein